MHSILLKKVSCPMQWRQSTGKLWRESVTLIVFERLSQLGGNRRSASHFRDQTEPPSVPEHQVSTDAQGRLELLQGPSSFPLPKRIEKAHFFFGAYYILLWGFIGSINWILIDSLIYINLWVVYSTSEMVRIWAQVSNSPLESHNSHVSANLRIFARPS